MCYKILKLFKLLLWEAQSIQITISHCDYRSVIQVFTEHCHRFYITIYKLQITQEHQPNNYWIQQFCEWMPEKIRKAMNSLITCGHRMKSFCLNNNNFHYWASLLNYTRIHYTVSRLPWGVLYHCTVSVSYTHLDVYKRQ